MRSFFSRLVLFGILFHCYVGIRLIPALPVGPVWRAVMVLWLIASCVIVPLGMQRRDGGATGWRAVLAWAGLLEMGFFSFLLTLTVLRDITLGVWAIATRFWTGAAAALPFDAWRVESAEGVLLGAFLMTVVGIYNARRRAPVVRVDIPIDDLPPALHGFTIAQISDIHVGPTIRKRYLDPIVDAVNRLDADMVAITGDVVDGSVPALHAHTQPLSRLKGRHGVFLCTGNHEYYAGADAWIAEFRRLGIRVLMNEHVVLEHGGEPLLLGGVTDYSGAHFGEMHRSDPARAIAGAPEAARFRLLLAHQPRSAAAADAAGFTLQLSGHTHGGQFFPWNFAVRMQQPFTAGLVRSGAMWLYISRGTGYWGPPIRFAAPSEITHLRLVPRNAS
ncbi:MAG: metallophosphoesterase [Janthinobacterium lividum]